MPMRYHARRALSWLWDERVRVARYFITGCSAVVVDAGLYVVFTRIIGFSEVPSNVICTAIAAAYVFVMNKFWSFGSHGNTARQSRRFITLFIFNYAFNQGAFYLLVERAHLYDLLVKFGLIALMVSWNFLLYKYWVYAVE